MKKFSVLVASLAIVSFLACSKKPSSSDSSSSSAKVSGKTLVFARPGDSVGLDGARHEDGESLNIATNMVETLVRFKTGTGEIEPWLAKSWDISKDAKTYTFHLRENVKFSDGTPFNADAVVFSIERQWKKDHPAYPFSTPYKYWENMTMSQIVKEIKKVDDMTVQFVLHKPNAPFMANLTMPFMTIVSPTAVMKYKENYDQNPVGTGPYVLGNWKKDDSMELLANENYWGEKAFIKRVIVRVIPDNQVRLLELKNGSVHIMEFPNPSDVASLKNDPHIKLLQAEGLNVGYLAYNTTKKPFDNVDVRRALSIAIDRKRLLDEIYIGFGALAKNLIPPQVLGFNSAVADLEYNPEKAKELLKKAGIQNLTVDLWAMPVARPYNPNARKMAEFIQADWKRVGVDAKIISYDWGTYLDKIGKGEHETVLIGWQGDNGDPDNFFFPLLSKESAKIPTQNYSFYRDEAASLLMRQAQETPSPAKRAELYKKLQVQLAKDLPVMNIAHSLMIVPTRADVEGYKIHPIGGDRRFAEAKWKNN
ncbi:MAG: ABC transporter substrate-binding protein [Deltaproteobacteria bacterium]|nr:ABC transporter substrate-binding protein [Deltaproteobacteria bacterium]